MTVQRSRVSTTRAVSGSVWIKGGEIHDFEWDRLRERFHADMQAGGWQLCEDPKETTEYDEELRQVLLHITAVAEREVGNVFTAPLGTQPGDPGWQLLGHTNGPIELKGPPAGRDRFA